MRRHRFGTFVGGIDLPDDKRAALDSAIQPLPPSERLYVPIDPCHLGDPTLCVDIGQRVHAGQRMALAGGRMPVYAPADGVVAAAGTCLTAGGDARREVPAVELTDLTERPDAASDVEPLADWRQVTADELIDRIAAGGLTTCREPLELLADWCAAARAAGVDSLLADGMENEPMLTADHRRLVQFGPDLVEGLAILARAVGAGWTALAVDARRTESYRPAADAAEGLGIECLAVEHKYPVGHPVMLTRVLTGRKVPPGGRPQDVRVAVVDAGTCLAVRRWVVQSRPPTAAVVTVAGAHVGRGGNFAVAFGTPIAHVLAAADAAVDVGDLCCGGPMTGVEVAAEAVVHAGTRGLLSVPAPAFAPATVCIRCAWCTDHCPVRLNVADLNDRYELGQVDRARRAHVEACIGCGVCSYVCPARLPLTFRMMQLKQAVRLTRTREACMGKIGGAR